MTAIFSDRDLESIHAQGIDEARALQHLELISKGATYARLARPAKVGDGIVRLTEKDQANLVQKHQQAAAEGRLMKFVPASGAATRMFRDLLKFLNEGPETMTLEALEKSSVKSDRFLYTFFHSIEKFPFFKELQATMRANELDIAALISSGELKPILSFLLTDAGLNYAQLPKALIKFHAYPEETRTALEEHLVDAALNLADKNRELRLHFTLNGDHIAGFKKLIARKKDEYQRRYDVLYEISYSTQDSSTDTLSADLDNQPFRDENDSLFFRPGGHGALLKNLEEHGKDIALIRNIDNVAPDYLKPPALLYEKLLTGYLVEVSDRISSFLNELNSGAATDESVNGIERYCVERLNIGAPTTTLKWL